MVTVSLRAVVTYYISKGVNIKRFLAIFALIAVILATPGHNVQQKVYAKEAVKAPAKVAQATPAPKPIEYIVAEGDYLHKIATINNTTWQRLFNKNTEIKDANLIFVGQKLVIPTADEVLPERHVEPPIVAPKPEPVQSTPPAPTPAPAAPATVASQHTTKEAWMAAAGIPESEWGYVDSIVSRESGWNPNAVNKTSGACGLGQQLPCGKWAGEWNDPVAALIAQHDYVVARYGSYAGAVAFWNANHWY